jgi:hypothetical protein
MKPNKYENVVVVAAAVVAVNSIKLYIKDFGFYKRRVITYDLFCFWFKFLYDFLNYLNINKCVVIVVADMLTNFTAIY